MRVGTVPTDVPGISNAFLNPRRTAGNVFPYINEPEAGKISDKAEQHFSIQ